MPKCSECSTPIKRKGSVEILGAVLRTPKDRIRVEKAFAPVRDEIAKFRAETARRS